MRVASLYRYPVKGLSPQALDFVDLETGDYFPGDRLFALENGPSGFAGSAKLKILKMIDRCAATSVAPGAGVSDIDVVQILRRSFGHIDCGVYAQIDRGGRIARGDVAALTG